MADKTAKNMDPEDSPDSIKKHGGGRRANNIPMYLIATALAIFILIMALVAKDRSDKQHVQANTTRSKEGGGDSQMFATEVTGAHSAGIIPPSIPTAPKLPSDGVTANAVQVVHPDLDQPPMPPARKDYQADLRDRSYDNQVDQIQQAKFSQFMEAVHAKTTVSGEAFHSPASVQGGLPSDTVTDNDLQARLQAVRQQIANTQSTDPTQAYKQQLDSIKKGLGDSDTEASSSALANLAGNESSGSDTTSASGTANGIQQFAGTQRGDRWSLSQPVVAPSTRYELRSGSVIPATLISGINSELPGMIMAQVSQNTFDTASGRYLLIPQGSRLVGTYSSNAAYGQSRVLVAWQRIVFPDGKALDIGAMPGADGAGYAGYKDLVNHHYVRLFGSALLMSAITAGISYSQERNQQTSAIGYNTPSASQEMSQALGQQLGMATANMIQKNLNISPTLEIRPGYRFNVIVTKDIAMSKPYQSFDY